MIKAPQGYPHFHTYKGLAVFHVNSFYFRSFWLLLFIYQTRCCYIAYAGLKFTCATWN